MTRFDQCLAHILAAEGGYVNHPADKGGATNKGITQATYDRFCAYHSLPARSIEAISSHEVHAIYRDTYWEACRCDDLRQPLDMAMFDAAVQHGPSRAVKWLQAIVCTPTDGIIGNQTFCALHNYLLRYSLPALLDAYQRTRATFYAKIIASDPTQKVFENGWKNRMASVNQLLKVS